MLFSVNQVRKRKVQNHIQGKIQVCEQQELELLNMLGIRPLSATVYCPQLQDGPQVQFSQVQPGFPHPPCLFPVCPAFCPCPPLFWPQSSLADVRVDSSSCFSEKSSETIFLSLDFWCWSIFGKTRWLEKKLWTSVPANENAQTHGNTKGLP